MVRPLKLFDVDEPADERTSTLFCGWFADEFLD
jgi:hypothetical protein